MLTPLLRLDEVLGEIATNVAYGLRELIKVIEHLLSYEILGG